MARERTTKEIAERIDLNYFKRPHPMRVRLRQAVIAAALLAALWLVVETTRGREQVYLPGPVSVSHKMFESDCRQCHAPARQSVYWRRVSDQACLRCHDAPVHHATQTFAPSCASCHVEHQGDITLTRMSDRHCTQCHATLKTTGTAPHAAACLVAGHTIEPTVDHFSRRHPEFAVLRAHVPDPARIKLNHQVHLKPDLKQLDRIKDRSHVIVRDGRATLACSYCHQPDSRRASMQPINYEKHCMECHRLEFTARMPGVVVPHEKVEVVIEYAQDRLSQYVVEHPEVVNQRQIELVRRLPGQSRYEQLPTTPRAWVDRELEDVKKLLFRKTCVECHELELKETALPAVKPPNIPTRWMVHSAFSHQAHRALTCVACHALTPSSQKTSDVLMPSIESCRQCHSPAGGADFRCAQCHTYHDKTKERSLEGAATIEQLRR